MRSNRNRYLNLTMENKPFISISTADIDTGLLQQTAL
jgi:hypothetical protein